VYTKFLLENQKGRDCLELLGIAERIISEWILGKKGGTVWTASIWLRTGTGSGLL
jgi:hypothetical protein